MATELREVGEECRTAGFICLPTAKLDNTLGSVESTRGDYQAALDAFLRGYLTSREIGNEWWMGVCATNSSMAHSRLGKYPGAVNWSLIAQKHCRVACPNDWHTVRAIVWEAWSRALLGEHRLAVDAAERAASQSGGWDSVWRSQHIGLAIADVHLMVGNTQEATRIAAETISQTSRLPLSFGEVGRVSRWDFRLSLQAGDATAFDRLERVAQECEKCDLFDQGEILATLVEGSLIAGRDCTDAKKRLEATLRALPEAANVQLLRLGALS